MWHDYRDTRVSPFYNLFDNRHFAKKRNVKSIGQGFSAALTEDIVFLIATITDKIAHVLNNTEKGNFDLLKHFYALVRINQADFLRSGHYHRAGNWCLLSQGQLHIAGTWRQVDNQVIQLAPLHVLQKLLNDATQHGSTKHQGLPLFS